mmetsp:Transcript_41446/g.110522  ORF Transcript_41446/g.110522 Transcript_41446/m.110522 type:complete len:654 (+) Transcript_41446:92-2053(+)
MGDLDADAPALLEWLNSLEVVTRRYDRLSELADGEALLRVMHDLSPDGFPSPSMIGNSEVLVRLLEGLEQHLRDRGGAGSQDETCLQCLEQAKAGFVQPVHLAKLALVATVQNDLPKRRDYVEAIMSLSVEAQQAAQAIIERFMSGSGLDSPSGRYPTADRPRHNSFSPTFSPPPRAASVRDMTRERLDFTEVGLDVEERFRRLKDEYIAVMEEQERRQEERAALRKDLEAERKRRREAEEAEREAKAERKLAEEARERVREETRVLYEGRMLQEAARAAERLRHLDLELEGLREELGLARVQAANAEKLSNQLELCKQKIEEGHTLRRENKELRVQVDDLLAKPSGGGGGAEHMQRSLARAREDAAAAAREREEAQRQLVLLKEELASGQQLQRGLAEEVRTLRSGGSGGSAAAAPGAGRGGDGHGRALALEAGSALLAAATAEASVGDVVGPGRRGGGAPPPRRPGPTTSPTEASAVAAASSAEPASRAKARPWPSPPLPAPGAAAALPPLPPERSVRTSSARPRCNCWPLANSSFSRTSCLCASSRSLAAAAASSRARANERCMCSAPPPPPLGFARRSSTWTRSSLFSRRSVCPSSIFCLHNSSWLDNFSALAACTRARPNSSRKPSSSKSKCLRRSAARAASCSILPS